MSMPAALLKAPSPFQEYSFVIPDELIERAREVLLAANFVACQEECRLLGRICGLPQCYAHFILDDQKPPFVIPESTLQLGTWHMFRLELHKKSRLLWTLPDIPLGAPAPDDPNYILVIDDRLDEYDPPMGLGRVRSTYYLVKIPTLSRYAESLAYGYLRQRNPESEQDGFGESFWTKEMAYIGLYCKLCAADLGASHLPSLAASGPP
ncbi:hypothetical protein LV164_001544 [Aspergillus fumigatus]|nr:hypothetical protein KXX42_002509 [Aspergillus fumigatus]KAH1552250.1 hypothetical protein KXX57_007915 [Aspergillus fumigatus]KAH1977233.1 hypothetical protein KXW88_008526 [Aspergillus fumigatus]KAH2916294.1 hypothetical protein KXW25_007986 [Aspergillus fumigatus]KAH3203041.1 hypothetical protein KXW62_007609 [Aspergillus fumigatus]